MTTEVLDYEKTYESFDKETLASDEYDSNNIEEGYQVGENFLFFDFRRGSLAWPEKATLINPEEGEKLIEEAIREAEKAQELAERKEGETTTAATNSSSHESENLLDLDSTWMEITSSTSSSYQKNEKEAEKIPEKILHPELSFEVLNDGSTALVIKPGYRLKLNLEDLVPEEKFAGNSWGNWKKPVKKRHEQVNEYTISMDMKILEANEKEFSLFQTSLVHKKELKPSGKIEISKSQGECMVNHAGGVGMFGTFGDTSKASLQPGLWRRVVVAVKCTDPKTSKGEMRTWVGNKPGVTLSEDVFDDKGRFSLSTEGLFLFSSSDPSMMSGNVAIRTIRVEKTFANDEYVIKNQSRDKVS